MLLNNLNVGDGCKVSFESEIKTASDSSRGTVFSREYEGRGPEGNNTEKLRQSEAGSGSRGANEESCGRRYNDTLENGRCGGISAVSQDDAETSAERPGGMVDVSGLRAKLSELCGDLAVRSFPSKKFVSSATLTQKARRLVFCVEFWLSKYDTSRFRQSSYHFCKYIHVEIKATLLVQIADKKIYNFGMFWAAVCARGGFAAL